jgi:trans-aconitate methyltransferase
MTQHWNPSLYERNAAFVAEYGLEVVKLLKPRPGERILDVGCGDGRLSQAIVAAGCTVVGVDSSPQQVEAARKRGLDVRVTDAESLHFTEEFDAVFSNASLHWIKQPQKVVEGVWRALRTGGRFVGEFGAHGNVKTICSAIADALQDRGLDFAQLNPWYFPPAQEYRSHLEAVGFRINLIQAFERRTPLPGDILGWLETFAQCFVAPLPLSDRLEFLEDVRDTLRPHLQDDDGTWFADYVRLRFATTKPR